MQRTKALLLVVVLLATPALAGCAGSGGDGTTTAPTDGPATTTDAATTTPGGGGADAGALRQATLAAMRDVSGVRLEGTLNQTLTTTSGGQSTSTRFDVAIDADARRLVVDQTVRTRGRTVNQTTYLLNDSLYLRSAAFERQYGSDWVMQNVSSAQYDGLWRNRSALQVHTELLNVTGNVSVDGTTTVRGQEAYVLSLRPTNAELAELSGVNFVGDRVHEFDATLYVSTETNLPLRSTFHVNETVTVQGREFQQVVDVRRDFVSYGDVTVSLPPEADGAVPVGGNRSVATPRVTAAATSPRSDRPR